MSKANDKDQPVATDIEHNDEASADVVAINSDEAVDEATGEASEPETNIGDEDVSDFDSGIEKTGRGRSLGRTALWLLLAVLLVVAGIWWLQNIQSDGVRTQATQSAGGAKRPAVLQRNEQLERQIAELTAQIDSINIQNAARLREMEASIAQIGGVSSSAKQIWRQAEAEYLLKVAGYQAVINKDIDSTIAALSAADERVQSLGDLRFSAARAEIANALTALRAHPRTDIEGIALTLQSIEKQVADMKPGGDYPMNYGERVADATGQSDADDQEVGAMARAWRAFSGSLVNIVRIRKSDLSAQALLTPQESLFLRRNLELQLAMARSALIQKDQRNFQVAINAVNDWLSSHFDNDDPVVANAINAIKPLQDLPLDVALPDVSTSLQAFQRAAGSMDGKRERPLANVAAEAQAQP